MEYLKFSVSKSTYLVDAEDVVSVERFSEQQCKELRKKSTWREKPAVLIDLEKLFSGNVLDGHRLAFVLSKNAGTHYVYLVNHIFGLVNVEDGNFERLNMASVNLSNFIDSSFFDSENGSLSE